MSDIDDWIEYNLGLREKVLRRENNENKYLLTNFSGTEQEKDITKRTPLIGDFFRVKINVKALDVSDFNFNYENISQAIKNDFDMLYWAFTSMANKKPIQAYNNTFISQLKICNEHCPWCYVDDSSKNGRQENGRFFSIREICDVFEQERARQTLNIFRPSGGEVTIVIEQWLELLRELEKRNLHNDVYVYADTNLTTGHYIGDLENFGKIEENLLRKIAEYNNFGLLCSFKGTDTESFLKATGMPKNYAFLEQERWHSFEKLVESGIEAYPFVYDPNPKTLEKFIEKGDRIFGDGFSLKTWIFPLKLYGPEKARLSINGINSEEYQNQLNANFKASEEIMQELIQKKFGLNYKSIPRVGVKLKKYD